MIMLHLLRANSTKRALASLLLLLSIVSRTKVQSFSPATTQELIVESQLVALQQDDMQSVYDLASPTNKAQTGTIDRFSQMVKQGPYQNLIGHQRASILLTSDIAASKQLLVRVVPKGYPKKSIVEYWWSLSRCRSGPSEGCYMVDAVIPNNL